MKEPNQNGLISILGSLKSELNFSFDRLGREIERIRELVNSVSPNPDIKSTRTEFPRAELASVFRFGKNGDISLKALPATDNPELDAILLLIYVIQADRCVTNGPAGTEGSGKDHLWKSDRPAPATELIAAAKRSRLDVDRIDRVFVSQPSYVFRAGHKRGSTYCLTNMGLWRVTMLLQKMLTKQTTGFRCKR